MDIVDKEVCTHCTYYRAYLNTDKNWTCQSNPRGARETMYGKFSKPPKYCPYREMSKDEALAEIILRKLTNETL